jgi:feruloyl esterase
MARLNRTIGDLGAMRRRWETALAGSTQGWSGAQGPPPPALMETKSFGPNPGGLRMYTHVPERAGEGAALVVALHGCTQDAAGYAQGSGWTDLADRHGFAVLLPEQTRHGNPKSCFSWFDPQRTRRDLGEVASIRHMIAHVLARHRLDPARVYVSGLSAGAAMGASLLAAYPELFAAGGLVAGLPHGAASTVQQAFEAMAQGGSRTPRQWGNLVRAASSHRGPWPRVSVWHGEADRTVARSNADDLVAQWADVHALDPAIGLDRSAAGLDRRVWTGRDGQPVIERVLVPGLGHGLPVAGDIEGGGRRGPFFLEAGISSSSELCRFFGLAAPGEVSHSRPPVAGPADRGGVRDAVRGAPGRPGGTPAGNEGGMDVAATITRALRAAGLMRD